jgi:hypothetical protein
VIETSAPKAAMDPGPSWRRSPLRRMEWLVDQSRVSRSPAGRAARIGMGVLFLVFGTTALVTGIRHGNVTLAPFLFLAGSVPIFLNRLGRFGRYFVPVTLALLAYGSVAGYVTQFKLAVHYQPQLSLERDLTPGGTIPTVWLQQHLYGGHTGALEVFSVIAYAAHFVVPLVLGAAFALRGRSRDFKLLMFSILVVSVLGSLTFLLAPTAPPWLAAQHGYIDGVHHILKQSLADLHMRSLATALGDPGKYDVTAAIPSLHVAFAVICALTAAHARLPRWATGALVVNVLAVVFAIVYLGEHYVVDALFGAVYGVVAWLLVRWALAEHRLPAGRPAEL